MRTASYMLALPVLAVLLGTSCVGTAQASAARILILPSVNPTDVDLDALLGSANAQLRQQLLRRVGVGSHISIVPDRERARLIDEFGELHSNLSSATAVREVRRLMVADYVLALNVVDASADVTVDDGTSCSACVAQESSVDVPARDPWGRRLPYMVTARVWDYSPAGYRVYRDHAVIRVRLAVTLYDVASLSSIYEDVKEYSRDWRQLTAESDVDPYSLRHCPSGRYEGNTWLTGGLPLGLGAFTKHRDDPPDPNALLSEAVLRFATSEAILVGNVLNGRF